MNVVELREKITSMMESKNTSTEDFKDLCVQYVMHIFSNMEVDHREYDVMKDIFSNSSIVQRECADYGNEAVVIERKAHDLFPSIWSKNIYHQVERQYESGKFYYLVCDKSFEDYVYEQDSLNKVAGAVAGLAVRGFPPILTGNAKYSAKVIKAIFDRIQSQVPFPVPRAIRVTKFGMLKIDGIAEVLGLRLIERFGSIRAVVNASVEELKSVEGIGGKKAQDIFELVNKQWKVN
ncbi:MAG: helix-hairpin-helix domain-containing protein [Candidatus Thorarchaeota archaeon]